MHPVRSYLDSFTRISDPEWEQIEPRLERRTYKKGDILVEPGVICKDLFFIESGLLRFFFYREGEEVTKFFTEAPYCFTVQSSFTNETPSQDGIDVLEDAVVWEMSRKDAYDLLRYASWGEFVRKLIQEVQFQTEQILQSVQIDTAEERYRRLLEEHANLVSRVPLKYLASYLGIAPQSLSRIRKNLALKDNT